MRFEEKKVKERVMELVRMTSKPQKEEREVTLGVRKAGRGETFKPAIPPHFEGTYHKVFQLPTMLISRMLLFGADSYGGSCYLANVPRPVAYAENYTFA